MVMTNPELPEDSSRPTLGGFLTPLPNAVCFWGQEHACVTAVAVTGAVLQKARRRVACFRV